MLTKKIGYLLAAVSLILGISFHSADAIEWSWTGMASFEYLAHVVGQSEAKKAGLQNQDFELEHVHLKITADLSERLSLVVGPCLSHHEALSVKLAYLEAALWEIDMETILSAEIGRFLVPFGRFNYLAEATNYPTISRPMMFASHDQDIISPHDYPHAIFMSEYSDIGVNLTGNKWFGEKHQLWYGLWIANGLYQSGFAGHAHGGHDEDMEMAVLTDIAWLQEKRFASDNNNDKAIGGRLSYSFGEVLSVGGSYMSGKYDPEAELDYSAVGADLSLKLGPVQLDAEYATAPTKFSAPDSTATANILEDKYTTSGYYLQARLPINEKWELVGMYDILKREGPEVENGLLNPDELDDEENTINKISLGINYSLSSEVKIKTEYAIFTFKEEGENPEDINRVSAELVIAF